MLKKTKAFTLIELLVVIAIIGILTTIAIVALQSSRADSRDAKRLADVRQMQKALEMYFLENGSYPSDISSGIASGTTIYMEQIPVSPTPADGECIDYYNTYIYTASGSSYTLDFCLGSKTGELDSGYKRATNEGIIAYTPPPPPFVCGSTLVDSRNSQEYPTVQIGTQCWIAKNMNYNDGCASNTWVLNTDTRWCGCYDNIAANCTTYGLLYQWSAAMTGTTTEGAQGICPLGWHVPSSADFNTLATYLGGDSVGGGKLKQTGTTYWNSPNTGATNEYNFNLIAPGYRLYSNSNFTAIKSSSYIWSSSAYYSDEAYCRMIEYNSSAFTVGIGVKKLSFPVRCILNN